MSAYSAEGTRYIDAIRGEGEGLLVLRSAVHAVQQCIGGVGSPETLTVRSLEEEMTSLVLSCFVFS